MKLHMQQAQNISNNIKIYMYFCLYCETIEHQGK